jgi:ATP-dependent Lhr-like helicase
VRVGELDEEMVFESRPGETFILGASTWRIDEITHDRVLVSPAPGEPGKMPFWKGDQAGPPARVWPPHRRAGARAARDARAARRSRAWSRARSRSRRRRKPHALSRRSGDRHRGQVPDDRTIVIERCRDELGDWRVCVLTPFGSRIHIPWAMASPRASAPPAARCRNAVGRRRLRPALSLTPTSRPIRLVHVESAEAMELVLRQLGSTALFAGRFREAAGRALLLPRRRADGARRCGSSASAPTIC